jgi:hypothetical protein
MHIHSMFAVLYIGLKKKRTASTDPTVLGLLGAFWLWSWGVHDHWTHSYNLSDEGKYKGTCRLEVGEKVGQTVTIFSESRVFLSLLSTHEWNIAESAMISIWPTQKLNLIRPLAEGTIPLSGVILPGKHGLSGRVIDQLWDAARGRSYLHLYICRFKCNLYTFIQRTELLYRSV